MANEQASQGLGVTGLVFGILSLLLVLVPYLGLALGLTAIITSALQMKKGRSGMAVAGLVLGILGVLGNLGITTVFSVVNDYASTANQSYP